MSRRKAQHESRFLQPNWKPLPISKRTEKRIARAVVREISKVVMPKANPAPLTPEPVYEPPRRGPKPIVIPDWREGWQDGRTWEFWNQEKFRTKYFASPASKATQHKE